MGWFDGLFDSDTLSDAQRVLRGQRGVLKGTRGVGEQLGRIVGGAADVPAGFHKGSADWGRAAARDARAWNSLEREKNRGLSGTEMREQARTEEWMNTPTNNAASVIASIYDRRGEGLDDTYAFSSPPPLRQTIDAVRDLPKVQQYFAYYGKDAGSASREEVLSAYEALREAQTGQQLTPNQLLASLQQTVARYAGYAYNAPISSSPAPTSAAPPVQNTRLMAGEMDPERLNNNPQYVEMLRSVRNAGLLSEATNDDPQSLRRAWRERVLAANPHLPPDQPITMRDEIEQLDIAIKKDPRMRAQAFSPAPEIVQPSFAPPAAPAYAPDYSLGQRYPGDSSSVTPLPRTSAPTKGYTVSETTAHAPTSHDEIMEMQRMINALGGTQVPVSGRFDDTTGTAVLNLRMEYGLGPGRADAQFMQRLLQETGGTPQASLGMRDLVSADARLPSSVGGGDSVASASGPSHAVSRDYHVTRDVSAGRADA